MLPSSPSSGLMIAAPSSGSGKTVLTLALLRAFRRTGMDLSSAKAGPDYIDPVFHQFASGQSSVNLDPYAMSAERIVQLALSSGSSHLLVEAMMGLFDGAADGSGSAADLSVQLGLPVVLIVDAAKQSHSIAALVSGFQNFRKEVNLAGVLLNKVGSDRHEKMLREALGNIGIEVFGAVHRSAKLEIPQRHLGLIQATEMDEISNFIEAAADLVECSCDLERLTKAFEPLTMDEKSQGQGRSLPQILPIGQKISVAKDDAFSFIYPHLLTDWKRAGCDLSFFSPLKNEGPSPDADAVYLPGGYPELHLGTLANADTFHAQMKKAHEGGVLIYGECGGYMVLGNTIVDKEGKSHKMLGFLDLETSFQRRKLHLGYRVATGKSAAFADEIYTAHEFHYTSAIKEQGDPLFEIKDALGTSLGTAGLTNKNVFGSYMHLIDKRLP